jgi:uncharacterized lipoprotein YajG
MNRATCIAPLVLCGCATTQQVWLSVEPATHYSRTCTVAADGRQRVAVQYRDSRDVARAVEECLTRKGM